MTKSPRAQSIDVSTKKIFAAICTYQRYEFLDVAIQSVLEQSLSRTAFQILVIDNSPDVTISQKASLRWANESVVTWLHEKTAGLSNARNIATAKANAPIIAFLDDDAVADKNWLEAIIAAFEKLGPEAHVIGGQVRPIFGAPRPKWLNEHLLGYLSVCTLGEHVRFLELGEWVVGANIAYRTNALKAVGGFNTSLGRVGGGASLMSNDETELEERIHAVGGRTGYTPHAAVDHFIPADRLTQEWFRRRMAWQAVSDFVRSPKQMQAGASRSWTKLKDYLVSCQPADRTMRALVIPQQDSGKFIHQMSAIYETVVALLGNPKTEHDED